ncbi:MAG: hypothetical protein AAF357_13185, partial [Verrucomicrobiota bacterium]
MRWLIFAVTLLAATKADAEDSLRELRTLEFGFEVESFESDSPILELQWRYKQHLEELKTRYADANSSEA